MTDKNTIKWHIYIHKLVEQTKGRPDAEHYAFDRAEGWWSTFFDAFHPMSEDDLQASLNVMASAMKYSLLLGILPPIGMPNWKDPEVKRLVLAGSKIRHAKMVN